MKRRPSEKGQALVLIILAIVGIFGFAALAVDFGKLYSDRRRAQNAADAAVLAAGFASTRPATGLTAEQAAFEAARQSLEKNDYVNNPGVVDINVTHRQEVDASGITIDYYQATIHQVVDKIFSQFVYNGPFDFTVMAETKVNSKGSYSGTDAIRVLSPDGCGALFLDGGNKIIVDGGNITSDSTAGDCPDRPAETRGASCTSGVQNGSGEIDIIGGSLNLVGEWRKKSTSGDINIIGGGAINSCVAQKTFTPPLKPTCGSDTYDVGSYNSDAVLSPGQYPNGIKVTGDNTDIELKPGLYCLGDDFSMTKGILIGSGVMFYMAGGSFNVGGGTVANLVYSSDLPDTGNPDMNWSGMLIYMPEENHGQVILGGGSSTSYSGTIMAPGLPPNDGNPDSQYKCIIGGNGTSESVNSSIICYTLKVAGTAELKITYKPENNLQSWPNMSLNR